MTSSHYKYIPYEIEAFPTKLSCIALIMFLG